MKISKILLLLMATIVLSCNSQKSKTVENKVVYTSDNLKVIQLSDNVYQHISYLQTDSFGKVECNGMIVKNGNETVVFDTPSDEKGSVELILWIKQDLHAKIKAVVPTHFHNDCLGGLNKFSENQIPSYSNKKTIELARQSGSNVPTNGFDDEMILNVGNQKVYLKFFGEGHTKDNVVAYYPAEKAMFGGCLIKELNATKGYLGDANVQAWSATVEKVKNTYPDVKIIIPGHGRVGGVELLDYTIKLFKTE